MEHAITTMDPNPVKVILVPSPVLACILAMNRNGSDESDTDVDELSDTAVDELLGGSSDDKEDRESLPKEKEEMESADEEEKDPIRKRKMEIEKRRQEKKAKRAKRATKEAAVIRYNGTVGGRASKRRRDSSDPGEISAAAAAYEG